MVFWVVNSGCIEVVVSVMNFYKFSETKVRFIMGLVARCLVGLCFSFSAASAMAWDGAVVGKISQIDGVGGSAGAPGNYDFRVTLEGAPTFCTDGQPWGYVNSNDANFKGLTAMLLMAQATGKSVRIYTTKTAPVFCQIGYVIVLS